MNDAVARDMKASTRAFVTFVWPAVKHLFGGGKVIAVEAVTDPRFAQELDWHAGVDAWHELDGQLRSIGSRVQWGTQSFDTFTIRKSRHSGAATEYQKRLSAIYDDNDRGWLYPHITVQAYFKEVGGERTDRLLAAGVIKTRALFDFVRDNPHSTHETKTREARPTTLLYVHWRDLGDLVHVVRPEGGE